MTFLRCAYPDLRGLLAWESDETDNPSKGKWHLSHRFSEDRWHLSHRLGLDDQWQGSIHFSMISPKDKSLTQIGRF